MSQPAQAQCAEFPYDELWYLKGRDHGDKTPAESWGGYGQSFEDANCVYAFEDVEKATSDVWLTNGIHDLDNMPRQLLVVDIDVHKAPAGFDKDRVGVPTDAPLVKSQSGGIHVYFVVTNTTESAKESDFEIVQDLPGDFDIDIRGEFVKQHVVAPDAIPGVGGDYELVNDATVKPGFNPDDLVKTITLDGEPLLRYNPSGGVSGGGYERENINPPSDLPTCYAAGLSLRKEAPEDENLNSHKVNLLTALCGLAAGYDTETVADHFVEDYYPADPENADRKQTEYQVSHIAEKLDDGQYSPPTVETLHEYGILPVDEWCCCGLPKHDTERKNQSRYYTHDLELVALSNGIENNPYEDHRALLKACLYAREENSTLKDEKPPYGALIAVANEVGLSMDDPEENILGQPTYNVAKRIYADLEPSDV